MDIIKTFNPNIQRQILLNLSIKEQNKICEKIKLSVACNKNDPIWKERLINDYGVDNWRDIYDSVADIVKLTGARFYLDRKLYDRYLKTVYWSDRLADMMLNDEIFLTKYVNVEDVYGSTLLQYIARREDAPAKAKILLEAGASPDRDPKKQYVMPPLWIAFVNENRELFNLLLKYKADPNIRYQGLPILFKALNGKDMETIKLLLKYKADPNIATREQGYTALDWAIFKYPEAVFTLLEAGADPNIPAEIDKATPLQLAAQFGYEDSALALIKAGADVNAANDIDDTALHIAASANNKDMIELLLKAGADPNLKNKAGQTYLEVEKN